jgi:hypothetical protein
MTGVNMLNMMLILIKSGEIDGMIHQLKSKDQHGQENE